MVGLMGRETRRTRSPDDAPLLCATDNRADGFVFDLTLKREPLLLSYLLHLDVLGKDEGMDSVESLLSANLHEHSEKQAPESTVLPAITDKQGKLSLIAARRAPQPAHSKDLI